MITEVLRLRNTRCRDLWRICELLRGSLGGVCAETDPESDLWKAAVEGLTDRRIRALLRNTSRFESAEECVR